MANTSVKQKALFWFRRDLRVHDNAGLYHALKSGADVLPVFVFDRDILDGLPQSDRRVAFIHASVHALQAELRAAGGDLITVHDHAAAAIVRLARQHDVCAVYTNHDYEPAAQARDATVRHTLQQAGVELLTFKDQVIFERDEVLTQAGGMFSVFTPYKRAWMQKLDAFHLKAYPVKKYLAALAPLPPQTIPTLQHMGFAADALAGLRITPGIDGGEQLFEDFKNRINRYHETRDFPAVKGPSYLSVHLRFGTVSIRELAAYAQHRGGEGASTWLGELIWRDFYAQILWHRPEVAQQAFKPEYVHLPFPNPQDLFEAWCEGRTGYPLVDAAMRQLNQTGYMHNRLRMVTASFLVKDLLVDWRWGERYFADKLIDFDLASNNGGWQWAASTGCDAQPYFRIFNPVTQSEKFDAEGKFILRYCPELTGLSGKALHAPWLAKPGVLASAGIRLGHDYPEPVVDHGVQRDLALALFKKARPG
ncbi:cryptochrome/photolyase family protein [Amantichitinum ursilacus]|uniref:Deoxyribodipyrimidine photo-lyase n=1 Tax=Amantichitinum ursilacus TaxID=857265 RepID=A0A0N0GPD7_9NEIS|nr:deoxyribodipyrimidine photo-lyase [Amantichitinum ursilacus]KPC53384.1 Deoxyribodipyrimidine photo-lyase [Amantichitinum ursilacus]